MTDTLPHFWRHVEHGHERDGGEEDGHHVADDDAAVLEDEYEGRHSGLPHLPHFLATFWLCVQKFK